MFRVAINVPGFPTSSVRVTVSTSPVSGFVTVTVIVPSPIRSGSVTVNVTGSPTVVPVIDAEPFVPPSIVSLSVVVALEPLASSASS